MKDYKNWLLSLLTLFIGAIGWLIWSDHQQLQQMVTREEFVKILKTDSPYAREAKLIAERFRQITEHRQLALQIQETNRKQIEANRRALEVLTIRLERLIVVLENLDNKLKEYMRKQAAYNLTKSSREATEKK